MFYLREKAIETMNSWGSEKIPFLFLIDFEMKAIQLFRLDEPLPGNVLFNFHGIPSFEVKKEFDFQKSPVSFKQYKKAFDEVVNQIHLGNSFLTNLTFSTPIKINLSLRDIYESSTAKYKILVNDEFVCFSPETFITIKGGIISTFPMKGTIKAENSESEQTILTNNKEIAEHHTIVDLLRNDLSMVASDITLKRFRYVDKILTNEGYLLQISSEITGKLPINYNSLLGNIIFTLLPAGSVTGAPKTKTLEIIRHTETSDRGYYTGVCGVFDGMNLDSAVMIRFIEIKNNEMFFRSGGGITFQSNVNDEYKELIDKVYVPIKRKPES